MLALTLFGSLVTKPGVAMLVLRSLFLYSAVAPKPKRSDIKEAQGIKCGKKGQLWYYMVGLQRETLNTRI